MQRNLRTLQYQQQLGLVHVNPPEQTIERRVAGLLDKDRVKASCQLSFAFRSGVLFVVLQVRMERLGPDLAAHAGDVFPVLIIERQQLVYQSFRMHPT